MPTKALCVRSLARTPNADPCAARTKPRKQNIRIQHHSNKSITHVPATTTLYRYAAAHPLASTHIRKQLPKTNPHTRSTEHVGSSCWKQLLTVHRHSYSNDVASTKGEGALDSPSAYTSMCTSSPVQPAMTKQHNNESMQLCRKTCNDTQVVRSTAPLA